MNFGQINFAAQLESTPNLNSSKYCLDTNISKLRLLTYNFSGFQFGNSTVAGLNSDPPAFKYGGNQDNLSSSNPI